ncbi:hypothetical protein [Falsibacillus albus]|uniref:O-antigen ligase domain-containing protein n=1 Tax=Falsibacillus albus TaxID=2478915 RepID=A0A3L7JX15_9BACI|nr:hypothetical protein [Falsibacillus albus]RLQ94814.1 hypothetical protein D9X91_12535 [Falsibacillus albus]
MYNDTLQNKNTSLKYSNNNHFFKSNIINIRHVLLAAIVASFNILFYDNLFASLIYVLLELIILGYYFTKGEITKYIGSYLIFMCLSLEFDVLVGTGHFYGFKNFRIFGFNLGIITLVPIVLLTLKKGINIKKIKENYPLIFKFASIIFIMNFTGILFGLINLLVNDNNIQNISNSLTSFIGKSYSMISFPLLIIIAFGYLLTWESDRVKELNSYLVAVLIGVVVSMMVSYVSGNFGYYDLKTLLVTNVIQYLPFTLLIPFYKHFKSSKVIVIAAIIGTVLSLMYNAQGKLIIMYIFSPLVICIILWRKKRFRFLLLVLLILPLVLLFVIKVFGLLTETSLLFEIKLNQALSLLKIWEPHWLINMPMSPRIRIIELINILYEYKEKPWMLLFGKGYMGSITDHVGMLGTTFIVGSFSTAEWDNGTFYNVHGTLSTIFLYHGLFGLFFYLYMIKTVITNVTKNPWILFGGFWFLISYGFSATISSFGIAALLLGFLEITQNKIALNSNLNQK